MTINLKARLLTCVKSAYAEYAYVQDAADHAFREAKAAESLRDKALNAGIGVSVI